jgi:hypothetical protein
MDRRDGRSWKGHTPDLSAVLQGPEVTKVLRNSQGAAFAQAEDSLVMNHVVLTGLIAADPQRDRSRDGEPVTVLLVAFVAPDEKAGGTACCEVEVLDEIADCHRPKLRAGAAILISGGMTGAGGIWAKVIVVGGAS